MNLNVALRLILISTAIVLYGSAAGADYQAGQSAWQAGRHVEALAQWQAAARTGDGKAMLALGRAFAKGLGVPQNYVLAHMWLNLAAGRGSAEAARERDTLAANMIPQHIASAQERARAWLSGGEADAPKTAAVPRAAPPSLSADQPPPRAIREAQALMTALGYKPGPADGRWGPRTGRAYAAFQRDAGLPPGNVLTPDALRAMRAAAKGRNVAATTAPPRRASATQRQAAPPPANLHRLVAAGDVNGLKTALRNAGGGRRSDSARKRSPQRSSKRRPRIRRRLGPCSCPRGVRAASSARAPTHGLTSRLGHPSRARASAVTIHLVNRCRSDSHRRIRSP